MSLPAGQVMDPATAAERLERLRSDELHFDLLAQKLRELAGINLVRSPKNICLMAARLSRVFEKRKIDGYRTFLELLKTDRGLVHEFISAMTTNTTEFFRESRHFELLSQMLPAYLKAKRRGEAPELRVWCAASSSGQEVYSLVMTMLEAEPLLADWNLKVLATDIDLKILDQASRGIYSEAEVRGIPMVYRHKYLKKQKTDSGNHFMINPRLRAFVTFAPFNLMSEVYPFQQPFDIVFCRNVLIYFDRETALGVTGKLEKALRPGGFLCVGHSEAGLVRSPRLVAESSAFYRKIRL